MFRPESSGTSPANSLCVGSLARAAPCARVLPPSGVSITALSSSLNSNILCCRASHAALFSRLWGWLVSLALVSQSHSLWTFLPGLLPDSQAPFTAGNCPVPSDAAHAEQSGTLTLNVVHILASLSAFYMRSTLTTGIVCGITGTRHWSLSCCALKHRCRSHPRCF